MTRSEYEKKMFRIAQALNDTIVDPESYDKLKEEFWNDIQLLQIEE